MKVVVAQKGAREHFLAARALHRHGMLAQLVVDWYAPAGVGARFGRWLPGRSLQRAWAASAPDLPRHQVCALNRFGVVWKLREMRAAKRGALHREFLRTDAAFARRAAALELPEHDAFFGYAYASLEMLEAERQRGKLTVLDQIDPGRFEYELVQAEAERWPQYVLPRAQIPVEYYERNRREWSLSDRVVVNSEWSRQALLRQGVPDSKLEILPLAYEEIPTSEPPASRKEGPLRILWLGTVCVRKGIQYLVEAARQLQSEPVEFLIAGPLEIRSEAVASAPSNMRWLGQVPRDRVRELFEQADLFVLPTISDGFALTQLEALAHGVPVIVTPNCGRVVEPGVTGQIVPARDPVALAETILALIRDRDQVRGMAGRCREAIRNFSIERYAQRLTEILQRCGAKN